MDPLAVVVRPSNPLCKRLKALTDIRGQIPHGYVETFRRMLGKNASRVSAEDEDRDFPLWLAVMTYDLRLVTAVVQAGANLDQHEYSEGTTALSMAVTCGKLPIAAYLIEQGASVALPHHHVAPNVLFVLDWKKPDTDKMLELLLANGCDVNSRLEEKHDDNCPTLLQTTIMSASLRGVKELIKHGALLDGKDGKNNGVRHYANELIDMVNAPDADKLFGDMVTQHRVEAVAIREFLVAELNSRTVLC